MKNQISLNLRRLWISIALVVGAAGCSNEPIVSTDSAEKTASKSMDKTSPTSGGQSSSRYALKEDRAPDAVFDASKIKELTPIYEAPSAAGNRSPYTVWGKEYQVMTSSDGYKADGIASWYGSKFHGYHTSNGEIYDMYQLTAAHKSLPLPSYVLVTNLENGREIVVRVNDRGPFHEDRLIDLSYAAATRLGVVNKGTAKVRLEAIDPVTWKGGLDGKTNQLTPPVMVQVAAMSKTESAQRIQTNLAKKTDQSIRIVETEVNQRTLHKVQIGPVETRSQLQRLIRMLAKEGFIRPIVIELKG